MALLLYVLTEFKATTIHLWLLIAWSLYADSCPKMRVRLWVPLICHYMPPSEFTIRKSQATIWPASACPMSRGCLHFRVVVHPCIWLGTISGPGPEPLCISCNIPSSKSFVPESVLNTYTVLAPKDPMLRLLAHMSLLTREIRVVSSWTDLGMWSKSPDHPDTIARRSLSVSQMWLFECVFLLIIEAWESRAQKSLKYTRELTCSIRQIWLQLIFSYHFGSGAKILLCFLALPWCSQTAWLATI